MIVKYLIILLSGIIAGFVNILAGGGSALTIPALIIFAKLPSAVANGTNRIAILVGAFVGVNRFRKKGYFEPKFGLILAVPALIGAIVGSAIAVKISDRVFNIALAIVMLIVLTIILINPGQKKAEKNNKNTKELNKKIITIIVFFFIGMYGGIIQVGVGYLLMAGLALLTKGSLIRINSLKVFVVFIYTIFSLGVFIWNGKVSLLFGLVLATGNSIGAGLGAHFAVQKGDKWIKIILAITMVGLAVKLIVST